MATDLAGVVVLEAIIALRSKQVSKRQVKVRYSRWTITIEIASIPVQRGGLHGRLLIVLLIVGMRNLVGHVVDDAMLAALKAGCLQIGGHYRSFERYQPHSRSTCDGIRLFHANSSASSFSIITRCGKQYEHLISPAVRIRPRPASDCYKDILGGDVNSMALGRLIAVKAFVIIPASTNAVLVCHIIWPSQQCVRSSPAQMQMRCV